MKVKESFVTNSSSTSYIIYLPESIDPIDMIKDKDPNILAWIEDQDLNVLKRMFEKARKDSETSLNCYDMDMFIDEDEEGIDTRELVDIFYNIVDKLGLIVGGIDMGPDQGPIYYNIASKEISKKIAKIKSDVGDI